MGCTSRALAALFMVGASAPLYGETLLPRCDVQQVVSWRFGVAEWTAPADASTSSDDDDNFARALALDTAGNFYVGDGVNYELLKFSAAGKLLWKKPLHPSANEKPKFGHIVSAIVTDSENRPYVWNRTLSRIEVYTDDGEFVRAFPIQLGNGHSPSNDQLHITRDDKLFACNSYMPYCDSEADLLVYTLDGNMLDSYTGKEARRMIFKAPILGRTDFGITDRYGTPEGICATLTKARRPLASCVGFPANRMETHVLDESGQAFVLNDGGIFKIMPPTRSPVLFRELPNYRADCRRKLDLTNLTIDRLIEMVYSRKMSDLRLEDPELRKYLLRQRPEDLRLLRNAFLARAFYAFKDEDLERYFATRFPSYKPIHKESRLTWADTNDVIYVREIEEKVLGKSLDAAYPKHLSKSERRFVVGAQDEVSEVKVANGERYARIAGITYIFDRSSQWVGLRKGDTLHATYSPNRAYAVLRGSNARGANLWVLSLNGLGFEFYSTQYESLPLEIRWTDDSSFTVTVRFPKAEKRMEATWRRENDLWYKPSAWRFIESRSVD